MRNRNDVKRRWQVRKRVGAVIGAASLIVGAVVVPAHAAEAAESATVAVCLTSSTGTNITLGGDQAWYQVGGGSILYVGAVGDSGCREQAVEVGKSVTLWVAKDGTGSQKKTITVASGVNRVDFYTTKVTVNFPGAIAFGGPAGDRAHWSSTDGELLSNGVDPTWFRASLAGKVMRTPVSWPVATTTGKTKTFTLAAVQVLDGAGSGLPGVTVQYNTSDGSGTTWFWVKDAAGNLIKTDSNGLLVYPIDGNPVNISQQVSLNNTSAKSTQLASSTTVQTFQTTRLAVNYQHLVRYRQGGTPETGQTHFWLTKSGMELFPGSYSLEFEVPVGNPPAAGGAHVAYPGLTLDLTPGVVTKTAAAVRFNSSTWAGIPDGTVQYYRNGAWNYPAGASGATDGPKGTWVTLFDGAPTPITFALKYRGAIQQLPQQNLATKSVAYFQTVPAVVQVIDHAGGPIAGSDVKFYASSWQAAGVTGPDGKIPAIELLPVKHSFQAWVTGSYDTRTINQVSPAPVVFQTGLITSDDGSIGSYYTNAWRAFPADGVELLPSAVWLKPTTGPQFATNAVPGEISDWSVN